MKKMNFKKIITIAAIVFVSYCTARLFFSIPGYSDGSRTVLVEKFSKKGFFFKTYEGTGVLPGFSNDPEDGSLVRKTWEFSVTDPGVAAQIDSLQGQRLTLFYTENFMTSYKDGWTKYIVNKVKKAPN